MVLPASDISETESTVSQQQPRASFVFANKPRKYTVDPEMLNKQGREELWSYVQRMNTEAQQMASFIANTKRGQCYDLTIWRKSLNDSFGYKFILVNKTAHEGPASPPKKRSSLRLSSRLSSRRLLRTPLEEKVLRCTSMLPELCEGMFSQPEVELSDNDSSPLEPINDYYESSSSESGASPAKGAGSPPAIKSGMLKKRAIKSGRHWAKRYFVLYPGRLCYFKGTSAKSDPAGTFTISADQQVGAPQPIHIHTSRQP